MVRHARTGEVCQNSTTNSYAQKNRVKKPIVCKDPEWFKRKTSDLSLRNKELPKLANFIEASERPPPITTKVKIGGKTLDLKKVMVKGEAGYSRHLDPIEN